MSTVSTALGRTAAIIDIENVLIEDGKSLTREESIRTLEALKRHITGVPARIATGPSILRKHTQQIATLGAGITLVSPVKDAADHALLEAARDFVTQGASDLVIASGDHAFAELAQIARLHIITRSTGLSRRLRMAATSVQLLDTALHPTASPTTSTELLRA